jgi:hypothetical protein
MTVWGGADWWTRWRPLRPMASRQGDAAFLRRGLAEAWASTDFRTPSAWSSPRSRRSSIWLAVSVSLPTEKIIWPSAVCMGKPTASPCCRSRWTAFTMSSVRFVKLLRASSLRRHHCGNGGARPVARTVCPQVLHSFCTLLRGRRKRDFITLVDRPGRQRDFSLRRPTLLQEQKGKKKSACSVRNDRVGSVSLLHGGYLILAMRPSVGNFWNCRASWPGTTRSTEPASSIMRAWAAMLAG